MGMFAFVLRVAVRRYQAVLIRFTVERENKTHGKSSGAELINRSAWALSLTHYICKLSVTLLSHGVHISIILCGSHFNVCIFYFSNWLGDQMHYSCQSSCSQFYCIQKWALLNKLFLLIWGNKINELHFQIYKCTCIRYWFRYTGRSHVHALLSAKSKCWSKAIS